MNGAGRMTLAWLIALSIQAPLLAACVALAGIRRASTNYLGPMAVFAAVAIAAVSWRSWWLFWLAIVAEVLLILWHEGRSERRPQAESDHH